MIIDTDTTELLEQLISCQICAEMYNENSHRPRELPCKHTFCESCLLKQDSDKRSITCAFCRRRTNVGQHNRREKNIKDLRTDGVILSIKQLFERGTAITPSPQANCAHANANSNHRFWCVDCRLIICMGCGKPHHDGNHSIELIDELTFQTKRDKVSTLRDEVLSCTREELERTKSLENKINQDAANVRDLIMGTTQTIIDAIRTASADACRSLTERVDKSKTDLKARIEALKAGVIQTEEYVSNKVSPALQSECPESFFAKFQEICGTLNSFKSRYEEEGLITSPPIAAPTDVAAREAVVTKIVMFATELIQGCCVDIGFEGSSPSLGHDAGRPSSSLSSSSTSSLPPPPLIATAATAPVAAPSDLEIAYNPASVVEAAASIKSPRESIQQDEDASGEEVEFLCELPGNLLHDDDDNVLAPRLQNTQSLQCRSTASQLPLPSRHSLVLCDSVHRQSSQMGTEPPPVASAGNDHENGKSITVPWVQVRVIGGADRREACADSLTWTKNGDNECGVQASGDKMQRKQKRVRENSGTNPYSKITAASSPYARDFAQKEQQLMQNTTDTTRGGPSVPAPLLSEPLVVGRRSTRAEPTNDDCIREEFDTFIPGKSCLFSTLWHWLKSTGWTKQYLPSQCDSEGIFVPPWGFDVQNKLKNGSYNVSSLKLNVDYFDCRDALMFYILDFGCSHRVDKPSHSMVEYRRQYPRSAVAAPTSTRSKITRHVPFEEFLHRRNEDRRCAKDSNARKRRRTSAGAQSVL